MSVCLRSRLDVHVLIIVMCVLCMRFSVGWRSCLLGRLFACVYNAMLNVLSKIGNLHLLDSTSFAQILWAAKRNAHDFFQTLSLAVRPRALVYVLAGVFRQK